MTSFDVTNEARARVGRLLKGKWRLDRLLGLGGMAAVYAATHRNGNRVAVKILHRRLSTDGEALSRFFREAEAANAIDHPAITPVHDDDVDDEFGAFLVMDLLEGDALDVIAEAAGGPLAVSEVIRIADELLDLLRIAHARGIVHRDLKPANLFVTSEGVLRVLDFGIARMLETTEGALCTRAGALLGTPAFMSPEQARGRWDLVDGRTDLYAVGATLFTLLTGESVHEGCTPNELLGMTMTVQARSLGSVRPDLPAELVELVDKALSFERDDRWPDASSMQRALPGRVEAPPGEADTGDISKTWDVPFPTLATVSARRDAEPTMRARTSYRADSDTAFARTMGEGDVKTRRKRYWFAGASAALLSVLVVLGVVFLRDAEPVEQMRTVAGSPSQRSSDAPVRALATPPETVPPTSTVSGRVPRRAKDELPTAPREAPLLKKKRVPKRKKPLKPVESTAKASGGKSVEKAPAATAATAAEATVVEPPPKLDPLDRRR